MMNFYSIGTMQQYTQNMKSKQLWEQRKQNGFYDKLREEDPERASVQEQLDKLHSQQPDLEMETIANKVKQGKKLTPTEMQKLSAKNPELYKKAQEIEAEQKRYEESLKHCKTKEDVQQARVNQLNASITKIKSVENNPNIPLAKKLEVAETENAKVNACAESTNHFVASGQYAKLPTEAEVAEAKQEEREKEEIRPPEDAEQKPEELAPPADALPKTDTEEKPANPDAPELPHAIPPTETPKAAPTESTEPASDGPLSEKSRKVLASYRRAAATRPPELPQTEQLLPRRKEKT